MSIFYEKALLGGQGQEFRQWAIAQVGEGVSHASTGQCGQVFFSQRVGQDDAPPGVQQQHALWHRVYDLLHLLDLLLDLRQQPLSFFLRLLALGDVGMDRHYDLPVFGMVEEGNVGVAPEMASVALDVPDLAMPFPSFL